VQWSVPGGAGSVSGVYFGDQVASSVSSDSTGIKATSPSGSAGPVDIYAFTSNRGVQVIPEGFSYGPMILEVTPDKATTEGSGTGIIYGYGFGSVTANTVPSDLQVTVGGTTAKVTAFTGNAYQLAAPPFPLQAVAFTIPTGSPGVTDVKVTTTAGSAIANAAFTYLPSIEQYASPGSSLAQGVYDSHRDLYYFTDANKIRVFSRTNAEWMPPIDIPAPGGSRQRLWGISLSPDGSKLAVSDASARVIYVVDMSNTTSVKILSTNPGSAAIGTYPCGIAMSDSGFVYFAGFSVGGVGDSGFFKMDTSTGTLAEYIPINGPGLTTDPYLRAAISSDGARVFFNDLGYVFNIDTATDRIFSATVDPTCCYGDYEMTLSSNQVQFEATGYLYDSNLNAESYYALNDREVRNTSWVYGAKLSPDGSLLFQPSVNGIDVLDGRLGNLRTRVSLPVTLSPNYDALVANGKDNMLVAITGPTGDGIAVIDLTSIAEPSPLPYLHVRSSRAGRQGITQGPGREAFRRLDHGDDGLKFIVHSQAIKHVIRPRFW